MLLALAAAVFPLLIACVAIIISRPHPGKLLLAFLAGGVLVSVTTGVLLLATFKDHGAVLGNTTSHPSPGTSIVAGLVALLFAWLMSSRRGRALLSGWRSRHPSRRSRDEDGPSFAERRLAGATALVAFAVGATSTCPARSTCSPSANRERRLQQRPGVRADPAVQRDHVPAARGAPRRLRRATRADRRAGRRLCELAQRQRPAGHGLAGRRRRPRASSCRASRPPDTSHASRRTSATAATAIATTA